MRYDRQAADALRAQLGITEEGGRRGLSGDVVGTAGEIRALIAVLRLSRKQFASRFRVPMGTLNEWVRRPSSQAIRLSAEKKAEVEHALNLGREKGLLKCDPRETKPVVPRPEALLVKYRCSYCGIDLRKKDLSMVAEEFVHTLPEDGGKCGPVQIEDKRVKRAHAAQVQGAR